MDDGRWTAANRYRTMVGGWWLALTAHALPVRSNTKAPCDAPTSRAKRMLWYPVGGV